MITTTAYVLDARERDLPFSAASVTRLSGNALILRLGAGLGPLFELLPERDLLLDMPLLVLGSYQARNNSGHVTPLGGEFPHIVCVGGTGFGYTKANNKRTGDALRPLGKPIPGVLLPSGCIASMKAHVNRNEATAEAAMTGLRLLSHRPDTFVVAEGQSNQTAGVILTAPKGYELPEFPQEHRQEIFSNERLLRVAIRRLAGGDDGIEAIIWAILRATLRAGEPISELGIPAETWEFVSADAEAIVEAKVAQLESQGWTFGIDPGTANRFTMAEGNTGPIRWNAIRNPRVEAEYLRVASFNTDAELAPAMRALGICS